MLEEMELTKILSLECRYLNLLAHDMPERCQKDAWDMSDKYLRYALEMFEIFLRHTLFMPDIWPR